MIKNPDPIDVHVGQRLKALYRSKGYNQTQVGSAIGVTFQQVQKQCAGTNRISASALWKLAQFLEVPVEYFYEGLESPALEKYSSKEAKVQHLVRQLAFLVQ